jgi:hypothetical protein
VRSLDAFTTLMDWSSSDIRGQYQHHRIGYWYGAGRFHHHGRSRILVSDRLVDNRAANASVDCDCTQRRNYCEWRLPATNSDRYYTDGSTQNVTASSAWASSNTAVVAVYSSGLATAAAAGDSTITATTGSITGTAVLVVTSPTTGASLNTSRYQHSAITLNNGQVLIALPRQAMCHGRDARACARRQRDLFRLAADEPGD